MLDSFEINAILEGFRKKAKKVPDFNKHKKQIKQAIDYTLQAHKGQFRKYSGRPFIHHPLKVAIQTYEQYHDHILLISGILHDTIEDGINVKQQNIYDLFGKEVGFIVDAVSDNIMYFRGNKNKIFKDKIEKLLYGGMKDVRVLLLKIMDRDHNLLSLEKKTNDNQIKKCFETQVIYHPLKLAIKYTKQNKDIKKHQDNLNNYIKDNNITSEKMFKQNIYNISFSNLDENIFNIIHQNAANIIWKIEDEKIFKRLIDNDNTNKYIDIINIETTTTGKFTLKFKIKQGRFFEHCKEKIDFTLY